MRRRLSVLVAMVVMLAMASPALADPGKGKGVGQGVGGGDVVHVDNGDQKAKGGGTSNNPHVGGGCVACGD